MSMHEVNRLLSQRLRHRHPEAWMVCAIFAHTGMQAAELVALTVNDFMVEKGAIRIHGVGIRADRIVPVRSKLLAHIVEWLHEQGRTGNAIAFPVTRACVNEWVKIAFSMGMLFMPKPSPLALRATYQRACTEAGIEPQQIKEWLGL
jgi:integrase